MKISNITITILILTLNSYTFGQNTIYRGGGISNVAVNQTYNSNNNIMFQTNNTNVLITNNTNNNSRNFIQKNNDNIQNNTSRSKPVVVQNRNTNINSNPINVQQRGGNEVIEQRGGNISQRSFEPEQKQETVRKNSINTDNEITQNVVRNQEIVVQEIAEVVSEPKENKVNVGNENELNLAFSFPKLEISKEEKVDKPKEEKEIISNSKSNIKVDFQKKKNTSKSKKIIKSKKHYYQQKVRARNLLKSKLRYIKNTKLKVKTKKPYCRVVCYKF